MTQPEPAIDPSALALRPSKRAGWIVTAVSLVLAAAAVAFSDPSKVLEQLRGVDLRWLCVSFALSLLQTACLGLRWARIAALLGLPVSFYRSTLECSLSITLNALLPGAAFGDGLRALRHAHGRRGYGSSLQAVAIDRVSGQFGLWLVVLLGLPWTWQVLAANPLAQPGARGLQWLAGLTLLALCALVLARGTRLGRSVREVLRRAGRLLFTTKAAVSHLPLSVGLTLMLVLQFDLAARALGVALSWQQLFGLVPLVLLASSLPSSFGGWGLREVASSALFAGAGVGSSTGVAVCVVFGAFALIVSTPGLLVLLLPVRDEASVKPVLTASNANEAQALPLAAKGGARTAIETWGMAHAGWMLACLSFLFFSWGTRALALCGLCSLSVLVGLAKGRFTPRGHFGSANAVTALRALIVAALPWAALQLDGPLVAGIAVAVLALDVVDGYLARRHGNASDFGSSFDVETDALFVMVLSLVLYERGAAGPWVILAGAWRYVYVLAPLLVKTEEPQGRRSVFGRLAFVLMIVSFVLGLLLPPQTSQPVVALGVAVVSASFLYSFWLRYFARTH